MSRAGGRRCPLQPVIAAGHCRYKLSGAPKAWIRQAYCRKQAPVLPQLFDHVSHNFTPSQLYLVNTGLKSVGEKQQIFILYTEQSFVSSSLFLEGRCVTGKSQGFLAFWLQSWFSFSMSVALPSMTSSYAPDSSLWLSSEADKAKGFSNLQKTLRIYRKFPS